MSSLLIICKLPKLRVLKIQATQITPSSFKLLKQLPHLNHVTVSDLDPNDLALLKGLLPGKEIDLERNHGKFYKDILQNGH